MREKSKNDKIGKKKRRVRRKKRKKENKRWKSKLKLLAFNIYYKIRKEKERIGEEGRGKRK